MNKNPSIFKWGLYLAVSLAYAGEYNSLIAILEHARQLGGSSHAVIFYLIYCIPAVILLVMSGIWEGAFSKSKTYLPGVFAISAIVIASFVKAEKVSSIILCVFVIALFRQWTKALTFTLIQNYFEGEERSSITSQIVSLRFVVMILGATVGGYLGERQLFDLSLVINAVCYLIAAISLAFAIRHLGPRIAFEKVATPPVNFLKGIIAGSVGLRNSMGPSLLTAVLIAYLGANAFFALEYPILTSELGVSPSKLFVVYLGHIIGALIAGKVGANKWITQQSHLRSYTLVILLCISYAFVGLGSTNMMWISFQLGICAFLLPLIEIHYSSILMNNATQNYPAQNLALNFYLETSNVIGSALPLLLLGSMTAINANRALQFLTIGVLVIVGLMFAPAALHSKTKEIKQ